jgi:phosphate transport system substrate-binding protein
MRRELQTASRRAFLGWMAGAGAGAVALAACGGSVAPSPTAAASAQTPTPAASVQTPTPAPPHPTTVPPTTAAGASAPAAAPSPAGTETPVLLTGAGSTFDYPLFSKTFAVYHDQHPAVQVNYQSVGSGAGIQQLTKGVVDFGASDAPMTDQQIQEAGGGIIHLPVTLGTVAISYNLPDVGDGLKLTGAVLAEIYLGTITRWNDRAIAALNPDRTLPDLPIAVVHRSDGSGTTDIFTTYLAAVSPTWKQRVGSGTAVSWPVGIGGKGSEGVAGQVRQTIGAVGYFELAYAMQNRLTSAAIADGAGTYLPPTSDGASACAAAAAASLPTDLRVRIAGCSAPGAYPIAGFSWVLLRQQQTDRTKGTALVNLLWWLIHEGQGYARDLFYAPLPAAVVRRGEEKLRSVTWQGQPLLTAG